MFEKAKDVHVVNEINVEKTTVVIQMGAEQPTTEVVVQEDVHEAKEFQSAINDINNRITAGFTTIDLNLDRIAEIFESLEDSGESIQYHKRSSVWLGIKHAEGIAKPFIGWIIGKGTKINFWRDTWASDIPLREHIDLPHHLWKKCTARESDFINVDGRNFPPDISLAFLAMGMGITNISCNPSMEDI
ncbi:hypothetical protein GIB67_000411 [Kingdonia uniflora]|uniref:Uncharacterized protein n=1 Tax=Kingdonia uniflora TaxID=39325 RepID=A0A7J7MPR4_9MAGN|nr:hypothetical protein GIB67_000411 [Kingdonia uniflora]